MPGRPLLLLTNDDGIAAPGLAALARAAARLGDVWISAPSRERSTASHSLSLGGPVRVERLGPQRIAVGGTPADAVLVALFGMLPRRPDLVVSGINRGPNLGTDVIYSGTVAAAREAAMRGLPAIAVSLVDGDRFDLAGAVAARIARAVLRTGSERRMPDGRGILLNVNVPRDGGTSIRLARLGRRDYPETLRFISNPYGDRWAWFGFGRIRSDRRADTDGAIVARGDVSVTPLGIDQTLPDAQSAIPRLAGSIERPAGAVRRGRRSR